MTSKNFPAPDNKKSISEVEKEVLSFWKKHHVFEESMQSRHEKNEFVFFDGPPFATGLPHYGHILAGTIKDVIPRYQTMRGYRVKRKWGWDCHGVPVEFLVEKENKIGGKPGIEAMGVGKFNELCRDAVMRCAGSWEETVERMGRFVDFKDDYKTMDPSFMESVWWVFKKLYDKGLVYEGEKIIAYSPKLGSPLSNFEANLNYKTINDPALTVKFKLKGEENTSILAWTTTPWTLPSNLGLCVSEKIEYAVVEQDSEKYIVAKALVEKYFGEAAKICETITGKELSGKEYEPLFPFFKDHKKAFKILSDSFVGEGDGTGIVHLAPNFGEEDARVCQLNGINPLKNPIDENGYFDASITELEGKYFRFDEEVEGSKEANANKWVIAELERDNKVFKKDQVSHEYPFCWRTECALMYRGLKTWFVDVQKIKSTMLEQNGNVNWNPEHLKHGRFGKMLEGAPDWAISRNRYWGAPIPIWRCEACKNIEVMGSQEALENKCGKTVPDLHKHFVDDLSWGCGKCEGKMVRIPEVLDCWFESGAMPYGSNHYPFKSGESEDFKSADFIAEGLDQTRGWFYSLHVLGCALFGKNIYKNVITNGIVLAEDGHKMSKSKQNYPDPNLIFEKYGADSMRFYLMSSPVVRGENLKFAERGVEEVLKTIILPLKNAYQFFQLYANIDDWKPTQVTLVRHGEGEHNVSGIYSGEITNKHHLTQEGKEQVQETAQNISPFERLLASPFLRTQETAEIIKQETQFKGEIETENLLKESAFGEREGQPVVPVCGERFKTKGAESMDSIIERGRKFLEKVRKNHRGQHICAATHGDMFRAVDMNLKFHPRDIEHFFLIPMPRPAKSIAYTLLPETKNELDLWIISELQVLLQDYRKNMEVYKIEEALRPIAPFIDKLNNWYLRRSRKRFWSSGMDADKESGYETIHYVLKTLSKILAPICPFFADRLFGDLTGNIKQSVHLSMMPFANESQIDESLNDKIEISREIVRLSAGIRARKKVKLRQPLQKLQFALSGFNPELLDLEIIQEEANIKEIEILSEVDLAKLAQKIVKVDAKKVGRKFGKKTQELIKEGKLGNFELLESGQIKIAGELLEVDEYETGFLCKEGIEAESTQKLVVLLDTEISEDLKIEGFMREIVRVIQDKRKTEGFEISDRIKVQYETDSEILKAAFTTHGEKIAEEVLAENISAQSVEIEAILVDGEVLKLALHKK